MPSRSFNSLAGGTGTQYLASQIPFANNMPTLTLAAWVYLTAKPTFSDGDYFPIIWKGIIDAGEEQFSGPQLSVFTGSDGSLQIWAEIGFTITNAGLFTQLPLGAFNLNEWTHLAFTLDTDKSVRAYLNGVEITTFESPTNAQGAGSLSFDDSTYPWTIGVDVPGDVNAAGVAGQISDVRIYNRRLSAPEILTLATFGEPSTTGLQARWKLCGDSPEVDSSGNNHSLINHGATVSPLAPFNFCSPAMVGCCLPDEVPGVISSGSTVQFARSFECYAAPDWSYKIYWNGAAGKFNADGIAQTDGSFIVTMTPTQTAQAKGVYQFIERLTNVATGAVKDFTCPQSITQVLPNPATADPGDFLSFEEKTLAVLALSLAGNSSDSVQSYQIAGRAVNKYSLDQQRSMYGTLKSIVWRQHHPGALGPRYAVTFTPVGMP